MNQYCIVVANGSQARFFTLEDTVYPEIESGPNLVETNTITHPDYESGNHYTPFHGQEAENLLPRQNGSDHHASQHNKQYLKTIAIEADKINRSQPFSELVLVSQKRLIGDLKNAVTNKLKGIHTSELAKDLSKLGPRELHNYLAREKLLPSRRNPEY